MDSLKIIGYIYTDFPEKFGIPRQSGLVEQLKGRIILEPEYRTPEAVRGLEEYGYIWVLWQFEGTDRKNVKLTVRPPRLGGNERRGVFATRSPFRPNPIGLSSLRLDEVEQTPDGPILHVSGVDMKNKTPILDIKPYLPYTDAHPDAAEGFAGRVRDYSLDVDIPEELLARIPQASRQALYEVLRQDPRPSYQSDPERVYGMRFGEYQIYFSVIGSNLCVKNILRDFT